MNTAFLSWIGAPIRAENLHHSMLPAWPVRNVSNWMTTPLGR